MDIAQAILAIRKSQDGVHAEVSIHNEDIDQITWHDGNPTGITKEQIIAKQAELRADYDAKEYQRKRKAEYPSTEDQLDDIYHNGIDGWKATIKVTKDKYPKE
tara:strand:- start:704 stop:1012 length:309 start_codon:yes stop_codon:yes gene_type:complete